MPTPKKLVVFIELTLPRKEHFAVGPCPCCGRLDTWLNDVPLRAFCWGDQRPNDTSKEHKEWAKRIPAKFNIYSPKFDSKAVPPEIKFVDRRPAHLKKNDTPEDKAMLKRLAIKEP